MKKISYIIFILTVFSLGASGIFIVYAQEQPTVSIDTVSYSDLGVSEPSLLPSSPLYFLKDIGRSIRMFFTFNAVSKTELEILFADEKLAEAKKLAETDPENKTALTRAINNYQESQQRLSARIAGLEKNPNTQVLLDKLAAHTAIHERLFAELETRFQAKKELKEKTELTSTSTETGKPLQKIPKIKPYPLEAEESVLPSKNKTEIPASTIQIPTIIPPAQTPAETANPAPKTQEFTIEADDHGFYPSSDITVSKGTHVKITFIVRTINVYYGGLDFRSSEFKTESTKPGNSVTVEFTANSPLIITSYWPLTGVSKANLQIGIK